MMKLQFFKYQATGNDFVFLNGFDRNIVLSQQQIKFLCDRHFGIGSDGLIILRPDEKADFFMDFYNPDGSLAGFCGNGARASVLFAYHLGIIDRKSVFLARDGTHTAEILDSDMVKIQLVKVCNIVPFDNEFFINTGTQHVVIFVENVEDIDIVPQARKVRYNQRYQPQGTNVNFVQIIDDKSIKIRTYEKGVEAETLSCGTGTVASALVSAEAVGMNSPITVYTRGGTLKVFFHKEADCFSSVYLQGPANKVFYGEIEL